jgi:hypothetical protein
LRSSKRRDNHVRLQENCHASTTAQALKAVHAIRTAAHAHKRALKGPVRPEQAMFGLGRGAERIFWQLETHPAPPWAPPA